MDSFNVPLPFTRETWHGRILACRGVLGSMDDDTLAAFEKEHRAALNVLPDAFTITHRVFITAYNI